MTRHISPRQPQRKTKQIPSQIDKRVKHAGYPSFSFKYLKTDHPKYNIEGRDDKYFLKLIARFSDLSAVPVQELLANKSKALRCHPIDWTQTTESGFGIADEDQIVDIPMQFSVSANKYGRVMGFFIDSVFYVVWLDHDHEVYSK